MVGVVGGGGLVAVRRIVGGGSGGGPRVFGTELTKLLADTGDEGGSNYNLFLILFTFLIF